MSGIQSVLIDTNILVYAANTASSLHERAKHLREKAKSGELMAYVSLQNLYEFYAIITDFRRVENPLSPEVAQEEVIKYLEAEFIGKIQMTEATLRRALKLSAKYKIMGQNFYDLLLVSTMIEQNVKTIYTVNVQDFQFIKEITTINPFKLSELSSTT